MNFLDVWPYLLLIPALGLGAFLGWQLNSVISKRQKNTGPEHSLSETSPPDSEHEALRRPIQDSRVELDQLEAELSSLRDAISRTRRQRMELETEYGELLSALDAERADIQQARASLRSRQQHKQSRQSRVLADVDASGEEMEMLEQLSRTYGVRINRLTQQVQRQDSELQLLRQTVKSKTAEINEAEALIKQRDTELQQLIRQRQQRESDLKRARQQLQQRNEELRRLLETQERRKPFEYDTPPYKQAQSLQKNSEVPRLLPGQTDEESD